MIMYQQDGLNTSALRHKMIDTFLIPANHLCCRSRSSEVWTPRFMFLQNSLCENWRALVVFSLLQCLAFALTSGIRQDFVMSY